MALILENSDLEQLQTILNEIPFKYAYGLFQFLTKKVQEQNTPKPLSVQTDPDVEQKFGKIGKAK